MKDVELGNLAKKIKHQEAEMMKEKSKFQFALKVNFATKRAAFETEKANLTKHAEDAENQLKPVAEELVGILLT